MSIKVLHKTKRRDTSGAPCCRDDFYSIDGGDTWMTRPEFYEWKRNLIEIIS